MSKKIVIIGGMIGGISTALRIRELDEDAEIVVFEKGPHIYYLTSALPYFLSGVIKEHDDFIIVKPQQLYDDFKIDVRVYSEVKSIDREEKTLEAKSIVTGEMIRENYDKLVLSPGAKAKVPLFKGMDECNIFTIRNVVDIAKFDNFIKEMDIEDITVVGGGFLGLEIAENLSDANYKVTIIEEEDQVLTYLDKDMVQIVQKEIYDKGVGLLLNESIEAYSKGELILSSGKKIKSQVIVMAAGVNPETDLAIDADLEIGDKHGIKVDHNYLTNDKDIYAIGDVIELYHSILGKNTRLNLAGPTIKQGISVANHIYNIPIRNSGVIGTSILKAFNYNIGMTGLNEKQIIESNINYDYIITTPIDKEMIMPDCKIMHLKLLFEVPTGKILGAQIVGEGNVDKRIDVLASVIKFSGDLVDLAELELGYGPSFSSTDDVINQAGIIGQNVLARVYREVKIKEVRELVENAEYIIDVRFEEEYEAGHLLNSVNIPLGDLRERLDELPKDRPIYIYCRTSRRAYSAVMMLQNIGYDNVFNISGSFVGICAYEYYNDQILGRKPIVSKYKFM